MIDMDVEFYQMEYRAHNILLLQEASVRLILKMIDTMGGPSEQERRGPRTEPPGIQSE